ncbi:MAG TPA: HD domain-containing protein [Oscillospiraceae bacterium]|nr:HD domain-containing protein [Oscillospiraceae bacterium]HPK35264.1 HD domain-containing protein [Oscillospiraceae bacterium]HPR75457.1 HD domain-containing protein [Oscillospiraceae bacterium]
MPNRKKVNISREVCNQWMNDLNEITDSCIGNIGNKFKNFDIDIFNKEPKILYNIYPHMTPETLEIFHIMRIKQTWLLRHSVNVAILSFIITRCLSLEEHKIQNIITGALLHDVGKMVIPGHILQKPAALDQEEMALIYRHSLSGYHMIFDSDISPESKFIVLQHHERLDGSGYPEGLKGDDISEGAKIVMVADSLDAMTSYRPYKTAQSMPKALESIRKDGDKYDQTIIAALRQLLP